MDADIIKRALADITAEQDPTLKSAKMASICSALFLEHGVELVVVGGSAIELLTEGEYTSGDLDMCYTLPAVISPRTRHDVMGLLGARGGPRNWQVAGMFVDILGTAESFARTPKRVLEGPYGPIRVIQVEDLLVERVLMATYPQENLVARNCARLLIAAALAGKAAVQWPEVARIANLPEYRNLSEVEMLVKEVADELKTGNPLHPD